MPRCHAAEIAVLRPELEAGSLLEELSLPEGCRIPTDLLLCAPSCLPERLRPDARMPSSHRVAVDFAVFNAMTKATGRLRLNLMARASGGCKRGCHDTTARCQAAGIRFQTHALLLQKAPLYSMVLYRRGCLCC